MGRLLQWTTDYLKQHGSESPRLDAEILLAEACGCERIRLYTRFAEEPSEQARVAFRELVRRRAEHTPVAYLVGRREFYSLSFRVTPDVLIPRPETELLVVQLLDLAREYPSDGPLEIADVGTGSGVLAVCAVKHAPKCRVTAIDSSPAALEVARANARDLETADAIEFIHSDLFDAVPAERRFDFIVSNPPYVKESELENLAPDVRDHEPRTALAAGPEGVSVIERLIPQSAKRLKSDGWLLMEISPMIEENVRQLLANDGRFDAIATIKDFANLARVARARRIA
ncbi:MAG: peptide chain release factor N(5)-glutamine methyltransferase [Planctomycetes bacterium]|nr:peptide chain release factor N(5)-glutamine methyltransferase [Planctomycetota bacterium]